ncbi:MAG: response regulator transcription factor [Candidatus Eremiobacterota bacterium]
MSSNRILLVEDDPEIQDFVRRYLERDGFEVLSVSNGAAAMARADQGVHLMILDLMLPGKSGFDIIRELRASGRILPILVLTARDEEADQVTCLELGGDDYLTKPFRPRELVARVRALLRRSRLPSIDSANVGPVVLDPETRRVTVLGEPVELTPREYGLLKTLLSCPGKSFSREELLDRVWGPEYAGDARRVDIHISNLRSKLARPGVPQVIRSVWGVGYRYEL